MKNIKIILILVAVIFVIGFVYYAKKQWFDEGSMLTTSTISSDKVTRIASAGGDMRMYEITPVTAPYMLCVFIAASEKAGVDCFKKENYDR